MRSSCSRRQAALLMLLLFFLCELVLLATGCAFNISSVKQLPATFTAQTGDLPEFVLDQDVTVKLGTGFPTHLKRNTRWHQVGVVEAGPVFATTDQIVTVEASNIYEAQVVVDDHNIIGFYLPVDRKFVPVSRPISIETKPLNSD